MRCRAHSLDTKDRFSLCFSIFVFLSCFPGKPVFFFCGQKKAQFPCFSVEVPLLPLTPKHGFPSLFSVCRVSGRSPSDPPASALSVHSLCYLNICRKMPASTVSYFLKAGKTDDNWISCKWNEIKYASRILLVIAAVAKVHACMRPWLVVRVM